MRKLVQTLLDLLYPPRCLFCQGLLQGKPESSSSEPVQKGTQHVLCPPCARTLSWLDSSCPACAYPLQPDGYCTWCQGEQLAFDFCCALGKYSSQLRQALHRYKYRREKNLAAPFGELLSCRLSCMPWLDQVDLVTSVPLCRRRHAARGYNQSQLLAARISKNMSIPLEERLIRIRETYSQTNLNKAQRKKNLAGAFICPEPLPPGCHVLLVDDVLTTGATAHEAALALKEAGATRVSVAVLAR